VPQKMFFVVQKWCHKSGARHHWFGTIGSFKGKSIKQKRCHKRCFLL